MNKKQIVLVSILALQIISSSYSATITWTGSEDTDWHKKCNWSSNTVPTCSDDVIIPSGTANKPVISGVAHCKTIDVQTVASNLLTINTGATLEIGTCATTKTENRYVFVSTSAWPSTTSAATRDTKCNNDASAAGLCGTYKAWVSNSGANNVSNPGSGIAFYLTDGTTKVADSWTDLTDGTIDAAINKYANGTSAAGSEVWTGLTATGSASGSGTTNCGAWSDQTTTGRYGSVDFSSSLWSEVTTTSCQMVSSYTFLGYIESGATDANCATCYGAGAVVSDGNHSCAGTPKKKSDCTNGSCIFCCESSCGTINGYTTVDKNHYCFQQ